MTDQGPDDDRTASDAAGDAGRGGPDDEATTGGRPTMKDVSHVPPHSSDGVIRVFERGGEGTPVEDEGRGAADENDEDDDDEGRGADDGDDGYDDDGGRRVDDGGDGPGGGPDGVQAPAHE